MTTDELRAKFEATFPHLDFSADSYGNYYNQHTLDHLYGYRAAHASRDVEVEAMRKDTERYRWLRNSDRIPDGDYLDTHLVVTDASGEDVLWNNSLDVTIDAAMREDEK